MFTVSSFFHEGITWIMFLSRSPNTKYGFLYYNLHMNGGFFFFFFFDNKMGASLVAHCHRLWNVAATWHDLALVN